MKTLITTCHLALWATLSAMWHAVWLVLDGIPAPTSKMDEMIKQQLPTQSCTERRAQVKTVLYLCAMN